MWFFFDRLLQIVLLVASAAALFVVGAVIASAVRDEPVAEVAPTPPSDTAVEVRLSSEGTTGEVFVGQPLIIHVELVNLQARRADRQVPFDPAESAGADDIRLDDGTTPWEERVALHIKSDGRSVIGIDPQPDLLAPHPEASGRSLGLAPARATFVLDASDLVQATPGPLEVGATLPPEVVSPERIRIVPLRLTLRPSPANDPDRAEISLAVARVAGLRGESAEAIEAGLTALALDPLRDEALLIIAESWEQQGDLDRALEWYERYLETIPDSASDDRRALEAYAQALRRQR